MGSDEITESVQDRAKQRKSQGVPTFWQGRKRVDLACVRI
jgi:hypothetical protein